MTAHLSERFPSLRQRSLFQTKTWLLAGSWVPDEAQGCWSHMSYKLRSEAFFQAAPLLLLMTRFVCGRDFKHAQVEIRWKSGGNLLKSEKFPSAPQSIVLPSDTLVGSPGC